MNNLHNGSLVILLKFLGLENLRAIFWLKMGLRDGGFRCRRDYTTRRGYKKKLLEPLEPAPTILLPAAPYAAIFDDSGSGGCRLTSKIMLNKTWKNSSFTLFPCFIVRWRWRTPNLDDSFQSWGFVSGAKEITIYIGCRKKPISQFFD